MTHEDYKATRKKIGTQTAVAEILEIHQVTIARRETGALPITKESELALLYLASQKKPARKKNPA